MSFRILEYGRYPAQNTDYNQRAITGASIVLYGASANNAGSGGNYTTTVETRKDSGGNFTHTIMRYGMDTIRGLVGQAPIILYSTLTMWPGGAESMSGGKIEWRRPIKPVGYSSCTGQLRSTAVNWTNDLYSPLPGEDVRSVELLSEALNYDFSYAPEVACIEADITDEMAYVLRAGVDFEFLMHIEYNTFTGTQNYKLKGWAATNDCPMFTIAYLNPVEFFAANNDGTIDLESIAVESEDLADSLYLGALQRGDTGTPVKGWVKNLSGLTFDLLEIWDDHPEFTDPVHSAGSGTGSLDYIVPLDGSVSQRYTINFYSATEYEVMAEAFRDYAVGLHPQIDADGSWRGTTGTNFAAPSGGLTIPAVCWQNESLTASDEFEVLVLGNTTDDSWPADSNDQVEITFDTAGNPDTTAWRPVAGRRTKLRAAVTIDAATKKFYTRAIDTAMWPIGDPCWVGDDTNVDEGTVKSVSAATIGADVFTGSGLDDLTLSGNYNGTWEDSLRVEIDGTGTPDTFKWSIDGGSSWEATTVAITGAAQLLQDGIYVTFAATTGHTSADRWDADIDPWYVEVEGLAVTSNAYIAGDRVGTTLPIQAIVTSIWAKTDAASGVSETPANRIYIDDPVTAGFTAGNVITITDKLGVIQSTNVIAAGGVTSTYLELTADLTDDFTVGSLVMEAGTGDTPFWLRVIATTTTTEELKRLRLNVRT